MDNFRGDGIMCFFGAPRPTGDPCRDGFLAATGMLADLDGLNAELVADGYAPIAMGVSLAYGEAVVGRIGAASRHEYTAIGDVAAMQAALAAAPLVTLYKQYVVRFGLGYTEQPRPQVELVGHNEPVRMKFAKPAGPLGY